MIYGYARVSTKGQAKDGNSLEAQEIALRSAGAIEIYADAFTGTKANRPELDKLLAVMRSGDTMVVTKLDRIARSATQGIALMQLLLDRGIVVKVQTQYSMKNIKGCSLRLDIYATDSENKKYNIEIQRADKGAGAKRARYNSSLIDSNILQAGFEVENLAETYVIFITENDVIGKNKPIYHIDRYIKETEEYFDDGSHIIYVNASYKDDTELGKLMHDFSAIEPEDMITDDRKETALRLLKQGVLTNEQIAEGVGLDVKVVNALAEENILQTV